MVIVENDEQWSCVNGRTHNVTRRRRTGRSGKDDRYRPTRLVVSVLIFAGWIAQIVSSLNHHNRDLVVVALKGHRTIPTLGRRSLTSCLDVRSREKVETEIIVSNEVDKSNAGRDNTNGQYRHSSPRNVEKSYYIGYDDLARELTRLKCEVLVRKPQIGDGSKKDVDLQRRLDSFTQRTLLSVPSSGSRRRRETQDLGVESLCLQLHLGYKVTPTSVLTALRWLCRKSGREQRKATPSADVIRTDEEIDGGLAPYRALRCVGGFSQGTLALRLLQRILSGVGLQETVKDVSSRPSVDLMESDLCGVLLALVESRQLPSAHRVLRMQERLSMGPHHRLPSPSAIGYSILITAYGKQSDLVMVKTTIKEAEHAPGVVPDVIYYNSIIDAYLRCEAYEESDEVYKTMTLLSGHDGRPVVRPNTRTHNIVMKGLAKRMDIDGCRELYKKMLYNHRGGSCADAVSLNTLVGALVSAGERREAAELLAASPHPPGYHVEAYTELLDGFAKAGDPQAAIATYDAMVRLKGLYPNRITHICLMNALGIALEIDRAHDILRQHSRRATGMALHKAYYRGLLSVRDDGAYSLRMQEALSSFYDACFKDEGGEKMVPDVTTVLCLVEGLAAYDPPKVVEARLLVDVVLPRMSDFDGSDHLKVQTALLQAYTKSGDKRNFDAVEQLYRSQMMKPDGQGGVDSIALNTYLEACCALGRTRDAFRELERHHPQHLQDGQALSTSVNSRSQNVYRSESKTKVRPNVATYTILILALRKEQQQRTYGPAENAACRRVVRRLYHEMTVDHGIPPDAALLDVVLQVIMHQSISDRNAVIDKVDAAFLSKLLHEGRRLHLYTEDQFRRRNHRVQQSKTRNLSSPDSRNDDDEFLRSKGWNRVESGFRILTGPSILSSASRTHRKSEKDSFLESKGWNDVDSGFRFFL